MTRLHRCCSSLSVWVRNCDSLSLEEDERATLDTLIDQLYDDLDKGKLQGKYFT